MAESIKWVEETDTELPLDRQVPHSGSWEDEGEVRHKYAVELDLNGQVKVEVLEGEAQKATNGESIEELAVTLELVSNDFLPPWTLFNISCYRKRLSQSHWKCLRRRYVHSKLDFHEINIDNLGTGQSGS